MKPAASLDSVEKASKYHVDNPTTSTSSFTKKFAVVALKAALNVSMVLSPTWSLLQLSHI